MPILWQHLFWWFGHPEVYILILPFFGIITDVIAVFARRPVFGYQALVHATLAIAALSMGVWAHHMFATGAVLLPFFSGLSLLIAVPTGVKFFSWIGTMWGGQISFDSPMLFSLGFLCMFVLGGLSGVRWRHPLDFHLHDSYFVVAHLHYVLFGGSVFAPYAGIYFWFPKFFGRRLHEGWARLHFVLMFIGFNMTFFVQHRLGLEGMPRRVADYLPSDGFTFLNQISTIGSFLLGVSTLPFLWNVWRTLRRGGRGRQPVGRPHARGHLLSSARGELQRGAAPIRSERPWDANHPDAPSTNGSSSERERDPILT